MTRAVKSTTMQSEMRPLRIELRRRENRSLFASFALATILVCLSACSTTTPETYDLFDDQLPACPDSPNCVISTSNDERHTIAPIALISGDPESWNAVVAQIRSSPRTTVVFESDYALLAQYRSAVFAFVDDLELLLSDDGKIVHIRSASRIGYYDFGANRARVESLREALRKKGIAQ
jgi:uncharacterized protein (DUF1499 family)